MAKKNSFKSAVSKLIKSQPFASCILILLLAVLFVTILWDINFLERNQFITILGIIFSAAITIFITFIQLDRNREENRINREDHTRNKFMVYAYKEIIPSIHGLQKSLSRTYAFCVSLPINLKLNLENTDIFRFDTPEIRQNLLIEKAQLYSSVSDFLFTIERFEIAMADLVQYKVFIADEINTLLENPAGNSNLDLIDGVLSKICSDFNKRSSFLKKLEQEINRCSERIIEITGWLSDFIIIIQNHFLSDVFKAKLPMRKTLDPKYKILTDIVSEKILKKLDKV